MPTAIHTDRLAAARAALQGAGQAHILDHAGALGAAELGAFLDEIESVDWAEAAKLVESHVLTKPELAVQGNLQPAEWTPAKPDAGTAARYQEAHARGEALLRAGAVALFTVAGGQGTRLGWDAPKGTFPASPVRKASLFQLFAEGLKKARAKYHAALPWYVMTSPINHAATVAFFKEHAYFGLPEADVMFFPQAMMPAFDAADGRVLLEGPGRLALSPNGHGGSLKALWTSGAIADMRRRGVKQISYVQVDNPLVKGLDPLFLGLHDLGGAEMSSKALAKAHAKEKVGLFAREDGVLKVIEYSNLPDAVAEQRGPDGRLLHIAGSIAIHVIAVDFVARLNEKGFSLPWNRADKKVPFWNGSAKVAPSAPNAVKLETFVFDALPLTRRSIILETLREEEFAPIKNADQPGAAWNDLKNSTDSPATSALLQVERAARWLEAAGANVPRDAAGRCTACIDLPPSVAIAPEDLRGVKVELKAGGECVVG